jgi:hypothetical protein
MSIHCEKTTLGKLKRCNDLGTLGKISELVPPGSYKFRVAKLIDAVEADLQGMHKQHTALLKKYGVPAKDDKGNAVLTTVGAPPANVEKFNEEFGKLLETETTIPYEPVLWSRLGKEAQDKLTVGDVRLMGVLLVDDTEDTAPVPALASVPPDKK